MNCCMFIFKKSYIWVSVTRLIALCSARLLQEEESGGRRRLIDTQRIREVASGAASVAAAATTSVQAAGLGLFASALRSLQDIQTHLEAPSAEAPLDRSPPPQRQGDGVGATGLSVEGVEEVVLKTGTALKRSSAGLMLGIVGTVGRLLGADDDGAAASEDLHPGPGSLFPRRPNADDGAPSNDQSAKAGALLAEALLRSRGDLRERDGAGQGTA
jgi:hypothetical protein